MELKELKSIQNTGQLPEQKPSLSDKMVPAGEVLGTTTGKSTLTDRKAINNLPKYNLGKINEWMDKKNSMFGTNMGAVTSSVGGAIDFVGGIASAGLFNTTADDALMDAGTSTGNIGGINYTRQNDVNAAQISALTGAENTANTVGLMGKGASLGASVGSVAGPVGGLIGGAVGAIGGLVGGLIGGDTRKRKMRQMIAEAKDKAFRQNDFSRSGALTSALQQQYAQQYGDTESQSLYGFADGKEGVINPLTMTTVKNHVIETSHGKDYGPQNSWTLEGEIIWDTKNDPAGLNMHIVDHGPNDGARSFLTDSDAVFSTKGNMNLKALANAGNPIGLQAILNEQADMKQKKSKGLFTAKCGKLPKFNDGTAFAINNVLGNVVPAITQFARANEIKNLELYKPKSEQLASNSGIYEGLHDMDQSINPYYIMPNVYNMLSKGYNQINNIGGISGGLRNMLRLGALRDAMNSMYDQFRNIDKINAQFKQQLGQAKINAYSGIADRAMKGRWSDDATYAQEHGNLTLGISESLANAYGLFGNAYKGFNDWAMFNRNMNYFEDELAERKAEREAKSAEQIKQQNTAYSKALYKSFGINPYLTMLVLQNATSIPQSTVKNIAAKQIKEDKKAARIAKRETQKLARLQAKTEKLLSKSYFSPFMPKDAIINENGTGWVGTSILPYINLYNKGTRQ